jgi:hypothetical protein
VAEMASCRLSGQGISGSSRPLRSTVPDLLALYVGFQTPGNAQTLMVAAPSRSFLIGIR